MTVVLRDINVKKRKNSISFDGGQSTEMLSLHDYLKIAKRCIISFANSRLSQHMLKDEDAIAHVSEHLMAAHCRWRKDGGRTLRSYLNQCAIWSIQVWTTKLYHANQNCVYSLNHDTNTSGQQFYSLIADPKSKQPYDIIFNNSSVAVSELIKSDCLTSVQKTCLQQRYIENKKLQQIADNIGSTRQNVHQHIEKAKNRLRVEYA